MNKCRNLLHRSKENESGAAMILVLCILTVFLALSVSVLLAGAVALNTARNNVSYEQGKAQAVSLNNLVIDDMTNNGTIDESESQPGIKSYIKNLMIHSGNSWPSYDPTSGEAKPDGAVKTYKISASGSEDYSVDVEICWSGASEGEDESRFAGTKIWITVVSEMRSPKYSIRSEFEVNVAKATESSGYDWTWTYNGSEQP